MTIKLPPELESKLKAAASARGVDANEHAVQILTDALPVAVSHQLGPDKATLALLERWAEEIEKDATDDPEELARREREAEEFMQNLNRNRQEMEGPNSRLLWPPADVSPSK